MEQDKLDREKFIGDAILVVEKLDRISDNLEEFLNDHEDSLEGKLWRGLEALQADMVDQLLALQSHVDDLETEND